MTMSEQAKKEFVADMLCIADTDWVLGHWYIRWRISSYWSWAY